MLFILFPLNFLILAMGDTAFCHHLHQQIKDI